MLDVYEVLGVTRLYAYHDLSNFWVALDEGLLEELVRDVSGLSERATAKNVRLAEPWRAHCCELVLSP